jgi:hypothetical protein
LRWLRDCRFGCWRVGCFGSSAAGFPSAGSGVVAVSVGLWWCSRPPRDARAASRSAYAFAAGVPGAGLLRIT